MQTPPLFSPATAFTPGAFHYQRHQPEQTLLYQIIEQYYPTFIAHLAIGKRRHAARRNSKPRRGRRDRVFGKGLLCFLYLADVGLYQQRRRALSDWCREVFLPSIFQNPTQHKEN